MEPNTTPSTAPESDAANTSPEPVIDVLPNPVSSRPTAAAPVSLGQPVDSSPATTAATNGPTNTSQPSQSPMVAPDDMPQPVVSPTVSSFDSAPPNSTGGSALSSSAPGRKRWLLPAVIVLVLLLGGYAFGYYLPNQPSNVYSKSLSNSGKAVDALINYSTAAQQKHYTSYNLTGSVSVKSPNASFDTSLQGAFDKNSHGSLAVKTNVLGQQVDVNLRSVPANGSKTPDIYVQVTGVKQYLNDAGLGTYASLDGQWITIDHTLLDTYAAQLQQSAGNSSNTTLSSADVNDALTKVQAVNKQYLFVSDGDKAVLQGQKYLGKQTEDGRPTDHYSVGYSKAHLQAYVSAVGTALDSSKMNGWSKQMYGKNLSAALNLEGLKNEVGRANGNYRFDLWADTKTKLVDRLQFSDPSSKSGSFYVGQSYTGGNTYPFVFGFADKDDSGNAESGALHLTLNSATDVYSGSLSGSGGQNGSTNVSGSFTLKPSHQPVSVSAPAGSKSLTDVLNQLGLGSLLGASPATSSSTDSASSDLFSFSQ